ncbi:subtilase [Segatella salivae]
MKQLRLILVIILSACWVGSWAKGEQTITINGLTIGKSAKKITFSGEKAMIVYADGSKQTENIGLIQLSFTYSTNGGIKKIETADQKLVDTRVYNLNGQYVGTTLNGLSKGVYIANGKKVVVK